MSKDVNITKMVREDRVGVFRIDILYKYGLNGIKYPHIIKESFN